MSSRDRAPTACWLPATFWCPSTASPVPEFFALEDVLDGHVGRQINVEVERRAARRSKHELEVQSPGVDHGRRVHRSSAKRVVHTLSYQQARHFNVPSKALYRQSGLCVRQRRHSAARL